jgi:hypothetical protein
LAKDFSTQSTTLAKLFPLRQREQVLAASGEFHLSTIKPRTAQPFLDRANCSSVIPFFH